MVRPCRQCKRREDEIAGLREELAGVREQLCLLGAERDELAARLASSEAAREKLGGERDRLAARLKHQLRHRFGRHSERGGQRGEDGEERPADNTGAASGKTKRRRGQQPGRPSPRRRSYEHLPTEEVPHDFAERPCCPHCGEPYEPFDEQSYEEIHFEVRIVRRLHKRASYRRRCRCVQTAGVVTAPSPPKPIKKGRLSIGFLARLVYYKFGLGLPLSRIVALLGVEGARFSPSSLAGALNQLGGLISPLAEEIRSHNSADPHLHVDETSWKVFVLVEGKTNHRWWLWVFVGNDSVAFYLKPSRGRDVAIEHLGLEKNDDGRLELPGGRELLLCSDFYSTYQSLGAEVEGLHNAWCWAHIRRYFLRCGDGHAVCRAWSQAWVCRIRALYRSYHRFVSAETGSPVEAEALADCRGVIAEMDQVRNVEATDPELHEAARKVLATLDHEWDGLVAFLEHPGIDLDNNVAERYLRRPVVLRKGCYGSGSLASARLAADAWSIFQTFELARWNPQRTLEAFLEASARAGSALQGDELGAFLPWEAGEDASSSLKNVPP
ncbi:MAG: IS66 family transposase [Terriglobales bacterium]